MPRLRLFHHLPPYTVTLVVLNGGVGLAAILQAPHRTHADVGLPVHVWGVGFLTVAVGVAVSGCHVHARRLAAGWGLTIWVMWLAIYTGSAIMDGGSYVTATLWASGTVRHLQVLRERRAVRR